MTVANRLFVTVGQLKATASSMYTLRWVYHIQVNLMQKKQFCYQYCVVRTKHDGNFEIKFNDNEQPASPRGYN